MKNLRPQHKRVWQGKSDSEGTIYFCPEVILKVILKTEVNNWSRKIVPADLDFPC